MMEYKGYIGKVELDAEAGLMHGEVINTRDVITFQGESVATLKQAFQESVDDYLEFCQERGETPDKPFSGQFVTRILPELHRQVNVAALLSGKSLNAWVAEQLQRAVNRAGATKTATDQKPTLRNTKRNLKGVTGKATSRKAVPQKAKNGRRGPALQDQESTTTAD